LCGYLGQILVVQVEVQFSKIRSLAALLSSFVDDTFKAGTDHPHHAKQGYKTEAASKIGQPEN
jgi:hypothetical protein